MKMKKSHNIPLTFISQVIAATASMMVFHHRGRILPALTSTILLALLFASCVQPAASSTTPDGGGSDGSSVTNVVLVGALGDLAKKYLWQGLFDLYLGERVL